MTKTWSVWTDTGGTFTDCLALDPEGRLHRAKVLSSAALRARVQKIESSQTLIYEAPWRLVDGFMDGARLHGLGNAVTVVASHGAECRLELEGNVDQVAPGTAFELRFDEEAPVLAARWVTGTPAGKSLPPLVLRLATTRGTNALLERRGARTAFFVTRGFGDLLRIGDQSRADLFALDVRRPPPLYEEVIEVAERLDAEGEVLQPLNPEDLADDVRRLREAGIESVAVALMHSYRNPAHENALADFLHDKGFRHVSASAALAPVIKILPRAQTAVVDAYLSPIIAAYLERVEGAVGRGDTSRGDTSRGDTGGGAERRIQVMTSAGGLVSAGQYRAKDSLLSGPAGGVVGAAESGRRAGYERLIAFDMGGTSTDVSRYDGDYEYLFEHQVGHATLAAPALAIETVAAGGGSICWLDGEQLKVGPRSGGADPGPACYGAGGPLTLTDVNLLLGRLDERRFGIPIEPSAAEAAVAALQAELPSSGEREAILEGFLAIANERMADAVRRISVRRGYDPRDHALVAFGGAGGQHACALADLLGMTAVVLPQDAGLLSALGLGAAVVERFAQRQVLQPLADCRDALPAMLAELVEEAVSEVRSEGVPEDDVQVRRRLAFLRFAGQETSVEVEVGETEKGAGHVAQDFYQRYEALYGYRPEQRAVEVESLRVVASSRPSLAPLDEAEGEPHEAVADGERRVYINGEWLKAAVYTRDRLNAGAVFTGPALIFDDHSSLLVPPGWTARRTASGAIVSSRAMSS